MMNLKNLFLFVCGISIGVGVSSLFSGCGDNDNMRAVVAIKHVKPATIQKEQASAEQQAARKIDSLTESCTTLDRQLKVKKHSLGAAKHTNMILQDQIFSIIDDQNRNHDSIPVSKDCDSLAHKVTALIENGNIKDSLYEDAGMNMESQLGLKDSVISRQESNYVSLKTFFDKSLSEQKDLLRENLVLKKQFKHERLKRKLLSIGTMIITGAAATLLIR